MRIVSVASTVPETLTSNAELEKRLSLEPGWIERRTGILQRPTARPDEATSDLAIRAGAKAIAEAGIDPGEVGLLLLATSTPDHLLPPTAPLVAHRLALKNSGAIDLTGACAGFLYALALADSHVQTLKKPIVVIAANILTRRVSARDAATAALFSDGAGAVVLVPAEPSAILGCHLAADGSLYETIGIQAGGTREPITPEGLAEGRNLMTMRRGSALFKQAVQAMHSAGRKAMELAALRPDDIDWWIPHQANGRITRDTGNLLGIPAERTVDVIARYGNSSAATIPIALADAVGRGAIQRGDRILMTAAGAGIVSAGAVLRW